MALKRELGLWDVFALGAGAMISSGLFVLPGLAFAVAGPSILLAYALGGFLLIPAMLSQAELATAMPRSGGAYFHIERSLGAFAGMLAGLANWFSIALKAAFALIGIGAFARLIWPDMGEPTVRAIAIAGCLFFTAVNLVSVRHAGRFQVWLVVFLLASLLIFVGLGLPAIEPTHFDYFMPGGLSSILATAGLVFVSFGGLTTIANVAEEIHNPERDIPAGMFLAALVVSLLYVLAVMVTVGVLAPSRLADPATGYVNLTPLSEAAGVFLGRPGLVILSLGAMLAFITTANGGILAASRAPLAMSRDGLLPEVLERVSPRLHTPVVSILLTSGFMVLALLLPIADLVKTASAMMLLLFLLTNVAVIIMRASGMQNYRPKYRAPLYPWMQIIGSGFYVLLIIGMGWLPLLVTGGFCLAGAAWYGLYVRGRISRESALVYLVKKIASKEIYRSELDDELKHIALERDQVIHDRFDQLVHQAAILDLPEATTADQMFRQASVVLARRLGLDAGELFNRLMEREAQSTTIVLPGLAVPHIIVEGEGLFDMLLVRARQGVLFPGRDQPVKTAFILIGTSDERNYHLRALMAIAHIVQEHDFTRRWLEASAGEHLRDILLLSTRKRDRLHPSQPPEGAPGEPPEA